MNGILTLPQRSYFGAPRKEAVFAPQRPTLSEVLKTSRYFPAGNSCDERNASKNIAAVGFVTI